MLEARYTPQFERDVKRLGKKHVDLGPLMHVVDLVIVNTPEAISELRRHHDMHELSGAWRGSSECHVANAGDWLVIWRDGNGQAIFQRTGTHDELFR